MVGVGWEGGSEFEINYNQNFRHNSSGADPCLGGGLGWAGIDEP